MVAGTVIRNRHEWWLKQYVKEYTVSTSLDNKIWTSVPGAYEGHPTDIEENIFSGNSLVRARYVRMIVKSWHGWISLRADVLISVAEGMTLTGF